MPSIECCGTTAVTQRELAVSYDRLDPVGMEAWSVPGRSTPATQKRRAAECSPNGRVRSIEYRGVVSSALIYDRAPVIDYLRAVDRDTIVAAVERRGMVDRPAYALLRRCAEPR